MAERQLLFGKHQRRENIDSGARPAVGKEKSQVKEGKNANLSLHAHRLTSTPSEANSHQHK